MGLSIENGFTNDYSTAVLLLKFLFVTLTVSKCLLSEMCFFFFFFFFRLVFVFVSSSLGYFGE